MFRAYNEKGIVLERFSGSDVLAMVVNKICTGCPLGPYKVLQERVYRWRKLDGMVGEVSPSTSRVGN